MTTYVRHGDENHVVRPDRVIRTGVVPPLYGFSPQQDVMQNARAFTLGPYMYTQDSTNPASARGIAGPSVHLMGMPQLMGNVPHLMGTPQLMGWNNPFKAWWLRLKANIAAKKLAKSGLSGFHGPVPNGPASVMAPQVVPMMAGRVGMLSMMAQQNFPPAWGANAIETIQRRWNGNNGWRNG